MGKFIYILKKTNILGEEKPILAIISAALGLLSLQFDFVSEFYAVIFPRFGIGLSLFLVLLIFVGFFVKDTDDMFKELGWAGYVIGIGIIIWAFSAWDEWGNAGGFGGWFGENFWAVLVLGLVVAAIAIVMNSGKSKSPKPAKK